MSSSLDERFRRVKQLALTGGPGAVVPLTTALADPNIHLQVEAVRGLRNIGSGAAIPALLEYLRTCDLVAVEAVARALTDLGLREAPEEMIGLLSDPDHTRRYAAAICLGALGEQSTLGLLAQAVNDEVGMVRRGVCRALGELGDRRAALALASAARDPDTLVRKTVAEALAKLNTGEEALRRISQDPDWQVRRAALKALAQVAGVAATPTLEQALGDTESRVRESTSELLGKLGAVEPVLEVLAADPNREVRRTAAEALGRSGDSRAAIPLLNSLAREGFESRAFILAALRGVLGTGLEEFLTQALSAPNAQTRKVAANALVQLGARNKATQVAELLDDSDSGVRYTAIAALGELRVSAGLVSLYRLMVGEDVGLRNAAAHALSRMPKTGMILEQAARHPSPSVREVAQAALVSRDVIETDSEEQTYGKDRVLGIQTAVSLL